MTHSFFQTDGDWFIPQDPARGPWKPSACHAGPPTGLLARAAEQLFADKQLCRLTVDLLKPVPFAGFRIEAERVRSGRTVSTAVCRLLDKENVVCALARSLHIATTADYPYPTIDDSIGSPAEALPGKFPVEECLHDLPAFNRVGAETRYPTGQGPTLGPTIAWLRTVPLLENEDLSGFQRLCPLADCGNAFGRNAEPHEIQFMNADLTVQLFRMPMGDWFGISSRCHWQPNGIGMSNSTLYDFQGAVGTALQTLVLRPLT